MDLTTIELFLFDIDGVFLAGKEQPRLVSGSRILPALRIRTIPYGLVTNTSTHGCQHLADNLSALGLEVAAAEIHSALDVTIGVAAERFPSGRCFVVGEQGMREAAVAQGLVVVDRPPADVVVVGLTRSAHYDLLSRAARCLLDGAALLGCHRNRLWVDDDGKALSCGPWLAALEYATGTQAEIFGKPSQAFFDQVRAPLGVEAAATLMVGDDPEADIAGAQAAGMRAVLVLTGKTDRDAAARLTVRPDAIVDEVDDLVSLLGGSDA